MPSVPPETDDDRRVERRALVTILVTLGAGLILGPFGVAANLALALIIGATPNDVPPSARTFPTWQGALPVDVPWWLFLAVSLSYAVILAVLWRRPWATLSWTFLIVFLPAWAIISFSFGAYYETDGEWPGELYLPVAIAVVVLACAVIRSRQLGRRLLRRRRRPRRSAPSQ